MRIHGVATEVTHMHAPLGDLLVYPMPCILKTYSICKAKAASSNLQGAAVMRPAPLLVAVQVMADRESSIVHRTTPRTAAPQTPQEVSDVMRHTAQQQQCHEETRSAAAVP